ncbi:MAG: hypothetical protein GY846_00240 [Deltaproteobacteria bacterium]|nr:hypothetical protein [Deltaproteobacteria bacterium]
MDLSKILKLHSIILLLSILSTIMFLTGCEEEDAKTVSSQRDSEIRIDGKDPEWQGVLQYYDENSRTVVSFLHDENYLFMRLASNDRKIQRQILVQGLTVWFEQPDEGNRKTGVHFPVGLPREKRMSMVQRPPEEENETARGPKSRDDGLLEKCLVEIQLWGPGEYEQKTMPTQEMEKYDVAVTIGKTERNLIYELKLPFTQGDMSRFGLLKPGKKGIRVGFQTGDGEQDKGRSMGSQAPNGEERSEGRRGRGTGGGMRGGSGGRKGGGSEGRQRIEPLELWVTLTLAEKGN